jgi:hypothetical protein
MARKPTVTDLPEHIVTDADTPDLPAIRETNNAVAAADAVIMGSYDAIKAIGRIEAARFYETVSEKVIAETAVLLKEGKKYKGLPYQDEHGNTKHVSHFDEFCEAFLGKTARRIQQLMQNYHLLGPNLYEQSERIGLKQRDYNALKALPAEDQEIVKQAIEAEDRSRVIDLMQEMAVKHAKEKEAFTKRVADAEENYQALDRVLASEKERNHKLSVQIAKLEGKEKAMTPALRQQAQLDALHKETTQICAYIDASLRSKITQLFEAFGPQSSEQARIAASQAIGLIIASAHDLAGDFLLRPLTPAEATAKRPNDALWTAVETAAGEAE